MAYIYKVDGEEFRTFKRAVDHAEYEMKCSVWPKERWSFTIYRKPEYGGKWKVYRKIKRVRVIEKIGGRP